MKKFFYKRIYRVALPILFILTMFLNVSFAENSEAISANQSEIVNQLEETHVMGIKANHKVKTGSDINNLITINPAKGRTVNLQMLDNNVWITKSSFVSSNEDTAVVDILFPAEIRKNSESKWRIEIPELPNTAKEYISDTILVKRINSQKINLTCKSAVLIRLGDGEILYDKNMNAKMANASTTKMTTAILALENGELDDMVSISKKTVKTPWRGLNFRTGEEYYLEDMLKSLMISSDNGAATAIAEHIGGDVKGFAGLMNKKAKEIGCENTSFKNPHGLDQRGHYSTAYDLSKILSYGLKNDEFRKIISMRDYKISDVYGERNFYRRGLDKLIGKLQCSLGGKTGYTDRAGGCYAGAFTYKNNEYIAVVMNSKTGNMFKDTKKLFDYAKKN